MPGPAGFPELLSGVDGDPDPAPTVIYGPVSDLAHEAAPQVLEVGAAPSEPVGPPIPDLTWQQQVDAQRADFGLPPLAGAS